MRNHCSCRVTPARFSVLAAARRSKPLTIDDLPELGSPTTSARAEPARSFADARDRGGDARDASLQTGVGAAALRDRLARTREPRLWSSRDRPDLRASTRVCGRAFPPMRRVRDCARCAERARRRPRRRRRRASRTRRGGAWRVPCGPDTIERRARSRRSPRIPTECPRLAGGQTPAMARPMRRSSVTAPKKRESSLSARLSPST